MADAEGQTCLRRAMKSGDADELEKLQPSIIQPMNTPVGPDGNDVNLHTEIGEMIKSGGAYKTYLRLLAKTYRQMEQAMNTR